MDDLDVTGEISPSTSTTHPNGHSGITLVLPSLRALQAANAGKKSKSKQATTELDQRPKIPRPIKLKPLKEVLIKLVTQIKKKDDYAFFIHPVNPAQVPGYTDVIKNPMDLGTMTTKVTRGKYRSLDEFTADFRLVMANAKTFNPPGSIYYSEADRLETWGLDHIQRASAHVIEYETDWNIDIEQDDDASTSQLPVNVDDEVSTPRDLEGSMATGSRAPSMTPAPGSGYGQGKRGPRGPYKKHAQTPFSEGLDAEGRMPGVKDGVGVFPAGSDWAELMIALKIKGKRYKTKKERLRFEKEGPPYHTDGSLDYTEMEDPFTVLNVLVPDPPTHPQVAPLYLPASTTMPAPTITLDSTQSQSQISQPRIYTPIPVTIPSNHPFPILSTLSDTTPTTSDPRPPKRRRHWTVLRNLPARSRGKDKDGDVTAEDTKTWQVPRDAGPADYGTFATFLGELAASAVCATTCTGVGGTGINTKEYVYDSEPRLFATIRSTVERRGMKRKREVEAGSESDDTDTSENERQEAESFWTDERAEEGWDYLRDVVYGGVDGYAYVRSLAEFVAPSVYLDEACKLELEEGLEDMEVDVDEKRAIASSENRKAVLPLGVSVARYVEDNLVDTVTRGRHGWLRDVLLPIVKIGNRSAGEDVPPSPFHLRLAALPGAARTISECKEQVDMAALIRIPEELAKEGMLESGPGEGGDIARALAWSVEVFEELSRRVRKDVGKNEVGDGEVKVKEEAVEDTRVVEGENAETANGMDVDVKSEDEDSRSQPELGPDASTEEDLLVKRLRLNLLALAKRAPLDQIARLPVELVPEHIRGIVPIAQ